MPAPEFYATPGYGDRQLRNFHYSQAVRVADRVDTSGQGGWRDDFTFPDTLEAEIIQAFDNLERTLATAGATWQHVIAIDSFHLPTGNDPSYGEGHNTVMVQQFRQRIPDRAPLWTAVGVAALGDPRMHVELRATAVIDNRS
jgi:enamine deaminase RidA (YjgF/YER057c/UK114 family)